MRIQSHTVCKNARQVEVLVSLHIRWSLFLGEGRLAGTLVTQLVTPTQAGSRLQIDGRAKVNQ